MAQIISDPTAALPAVKNAGGGFRRSTRLAGLLACIMAMIAFGSLRVSAQGTNTNLVLTVAINLTAYVQQPTNDPPTLPSVTIQHLTTKDVINAIGADLGFPAGDLATAKLLFQFVGLGNTNTTPLNTVLRTAGGDTNVNAFLSLNFPSSLTLLANEDIKTTRLNANGTGIQLEYSIGGLSLATTNLTFNTQGRASLQESSVSYQGKLLDKRLFPTVYNFFLAGTGAVGTNQAIFNGSATINSRKVEVP